SELLPNPSKLAPVKRQPALPWPQVPAFFTALRERQGMAALALVVRGVEGAYARSDLLERRRLLMEAWGAFACGGRTEAEVTPISEARERLRGAAA
ncbi:MAG: hypothetical protein ACK5TQ_07945, partial [Acetobacteraceae bacterium]